MTFIQSSRMSVKIQQLSNGRINFRGHDHKFVNKIAKMWPGAELLSKWPNWYFLEYSKERNKPLKTATLSREIKLGDKYYLVDYPSMTITDMDDCITLADLFGTASE